jgi:hypothetical protein
MSNDDIKELLISILNLVKTDLGEGVETTIGSQLPALANLLVTKPMHVPDGSGSVFKTEVVIYRSPELTIKINYWHGDDPRATPHTHPWPFESFILHGGYTEITTLLSEDGTVSKEHRTFAAGDRNVVPLWTADGRRVGHTVGQVLPGTVTLMVCGPASPGLEWGHFEEAESGVFQYVKTSPDPSFRDQLKAANKYMR